MTWRVNGFKIRQHQTDHWPPHVHVFKDNDFVGRYDFGSDSWIEGPYHARAQANAALRQWATDQGL